MQSFDYKIVRQQQLGKQKNSTQNGPHQLCTKCKIELQQNGRHVKKNEAYLLES